MTSEIDIKINKRTADDLLSFVNQTIADAQSELNNVNPEDKMLVGVWKNGIKFWNDVRVAIVNGLTDKCGKNMVNNDKQRKL